MSTAQFGSECVGCLDHDGADPREGAFGKPAGWPSDCQRAADTKVGVEHCGADGGGIGFDVTDVDGVSLPAGLLQDVFQFGVRGVGTQEARHVFTWQPGEDGAAGGGEFKRVGLELGGKTPHIVFDDANLDKALPVIEKSLTIFSGQFCVTASRLLVQRGVYETVKQRLTERLANVKVGPGI
jgi:hypothetical protein